MTIKVLIVNPAMAASAIFIGPPVDFKPLTNGKNTDKPMIFQY